MDKINASPSYSTGPDPLPLVARGLAIFPIPRGARIPTLKDWPNRCLSCPDTIARYWRAGDNIGVGCKASGVLGIDLDRHHAEADGVSTFAALCESHGQQWPRTLTVRTPRGGLHLYYRAPSGHQLGNTSGKLGPGVDTRGPGRGSDGGYLVGPGSVVDGRQYEIVRDMPIQPLPEWLVPLLDPPVVMKPLGPLPKVKNTYALKALQGEVQRILDTPKGGPGTPGRNEQLNRSAFALGQLVGGGLLNEATAEAALRAAAEAVGLMQDDGGPRQVEATIRSGLGAGMRKPRWVKAAAQ